MRYIRFVDLTNNVLISVLFMVKSCILDFVFVTVLLFVNIMKIIFLFIILINILFIFINLIIILHCCDAVKAMLLCSVKNKKNIYTVTIDAHHNIYASVLILYIYGIYYSNFIEKLLLHCAECYRILMIL